MVAVLGNLSFSSCCLPRNDAFRGVQNGQTA